MNPEIVIEVLDAHHWKLRIMGSVAWSYDPTTLTPVRARRIWWEIRQWLGIIGEGEY